jgi:hypothetical protein
LVKDKVLSTPNDKIVKNASYFGVHRSSYDTEEEFAKAVSDQIVWTLLRPLQQARSNELAMNPDISDIVTVTVT